MAPCVGVCWVGMSIGFMCANGIEAFALRRRGLECVVSELGRPAPLRGEAKKVALSQELRPVRNMRSESFQAATSSSPALLAARDALISSSSCRLAAISPSKAKAAPRRSR